MKIAFYVIKTLLLIKNNKNVSLLTTSPVIKWAGVVWGYPFSILIIFIRSILVIFRKHNKTKRILTIRKCVRMLYWDKRMSSQNNKGPLRRIIIAWAGDVVGGWKNKRKTFSSSYLNLEIIDSARGLNGRE